MPAQPRLRLSLEGACLDERSVGLLRNLPQVERHVCSAGQISRRRFATIHLDGEDLLADVATGSLYRGNVCLTSATLHLVAAPVVAAEKPARRRRGRTPTQVACGFAKGQMMAAAYV